jgi:hypothetical protein
VGIGADDDRGQRDTLRIGDHMVLGAGVAAIRRIQSSSPPKRRHVPATSRSLRATNSVVLDGAAPTARSHAVVPTRQPAASRVSGASTLCRSSRIRLQHLRGNAPPEHEQDTVQRKPVVDGFAPPDV